MTEKKEAPAKERMAPYVAYTAFRQFIDRYQRVNVPQKIDVKLLKMHNIASSNEWALLSALKWLNLVDADEGKPTPMFAWIQASGDDLRKGLHDLVEIAYGHFFSHGLSLERDSFETLRRYFATNYSVSQSARAAKFFIAISQDAGYEIGAELLNSIRKGGGADTQKQRRQQPESKRVSKPERMIQTPVAPSQPENLLQAKSKLLEKLPTFDASWQPEAIKAVIDSFKELMQELEDTPTAQPEEAD